MQVNGQPRAAHVTFTGVVEPGNGGRYEYMVWRTERQWYAAFPDYHATSKIGSGENRPDYVQEKMRVSMPDAEVMAAIINECQGRAYAEDRGGSIGDFFAQVRNG